MVSYCLDAFNKDTLIGKLYTNGLCNNNKGVVKIDFEYNQSSESKFIMNINNGTEYVKVKSIKDKGNVHQFSVDDWLNNHYNTDTVSISLDPKNSVDPFTNNVDYIKTVTGDYYNISDDLKSWKKITAPSAAVEESTSSACTNQHTYWSKVAPDNGEPYWGQVIPIENGPEKGSSKWGTNSIPVSETDKIINDPCAEFATASTGGGKKKRRKSNKRKSKRRKSNKRKSKRRKSKRRKSKKN